jgi:8-oxo-dGTP diphosphatase
VAKRGAYTYDYPKADITVDCVVFGVGSNGRLQVVLIKRAEAPYKGRLALPGGFIEFEKGETAYEAARREMEEETGTKVDYLEQLMTFDAPKRDPRGRVFSVAHFALVRVQDHAVTPGSDASEAKWHDVEDILNNLKSGELKMAFDHRLILETAVSRLQSKVKYVPIGFHLLPERFTLAQLQRLYEAILFREIDKGNFRKAWKKQSISDAEILVEAGMEKSDRPGPVAKLYTFNKEAYDRAVKDGFNFEI